MGDAFTGSYTFDTDQPPDRSSAGYAYYRFTSPQQRFIVTVGQYTWASEGNWHFAVHDNHLHSYYDTIMDLFAELHREGNTIVMVTHNPEIRPYFDRTIELRDGRLASMS